MKIYLATWLLEPEQGNALTNSGAEHRLLSYYHTTERADEFRKYVKTGRNQNEKD